MLNRYLIENRVKQIFQYYIEEKCDQLTIALLFPESEVIGETTIFCQ